MERLKIAEEIIKIAEDLVFADSDYIYDPDHKRHPGGGYHKTEKGWSKSDGKGENEGKSNTNHSVKKPEKKKKYDADYLFDLAKNVRKKKYNLDDNDNDDIGIAEWANQTSQQDYSESELMKEIEDLAKQDVENRKMMD